MKQLVLNKPACSGRGVRIVLLEPSQVRQIREESAKDLSGDSTIIEWEGRITELGVAAMVVEVTEKAGFKTADAIRADDVKWKKLTPDDVREKASEYFTPKDIALLNEIYTKLHRVSPKEVEDILGEALDVTAD